MYKNDNLTWSWMWKMKCALHLLSYANVIEKGDLHMNEQYGGRSSSTEGQCIDTAASESSRYVPVKHASPHSIVIKRLRIGALNYLIVPEHSNQCSCVVVSCHSITSTPFLIHSHLFTPYFLALIWRDFQEFVFGSCVLYKRIRLSRNASVPRGYSSSCRDDFYLSIARNHLISVGLGNKSFIAHNFNAPLAIILWIY